MIHGFVDQPIGILTQFLDYFPIPSKMDINIHLATLQINFFDLYLTL